jgi:hypothetical protein
MEATTVVELEGVNGEWFTLAGPQEGDRGIHLATDVKGLFEPPVKVVMEEPGNYPGARYLNHRVLRRDITFAVAILNDAKVGPKAWLSRDSEWRKAWAFDRDCKLYITTVDSGRRYLKIRLFESPEVSLFTDPKLGTYNEAIMTCVAGDPFWYEDDVVYPFETQTDTTFDPNPLPWPWPQAELPTETITLTVDPSDGRGGLNPTDQAVFLKWTVPGSSEPPADPYIPGIPWLGAPNSPATVWTIPDYSWEEDGNQNRRIRMPGLIGGLRTEGVQKVYIDGRPTGGTFALTFDGQTTTPIAYNASPATVKAALIALSNIAAPDINVAQAGAENEHQSVQITGGATGGTFTLTVNGETTAPIPFNPSDREMLTALQGLPSIGQSDVSVKSTFSVDSQKIKLVGEPTGGTFTLTFDGQTTAPIAYDATASEVQTALTALSNINPGDISVGSDDEWEHSPYHVAFGGQSLLSSIPIVGSIPIIGDLIKGIAGLLEGLFGSLLGGSGEENRLAGVDVSQITGDASGLTGGSGLAVEVTTEVAGSRVFDVEFRGAYSGVNLAQMTGSAAGLTGGSTPAVTVATTVDGSRPYIVTFLHTGGWSGQGITPPGMEINTASLTGGSPGGRVAVTTEGVTAPGENVVVDTDPRVEQVSSASGSQVWARMNGVRFRHPVPPWTESKTFEITVSGCEPGQVGTLRIPRPWSRPWGLE